MFAQRGIGVTDLLPEPAGRTLDDVPSTNGIPRHRDRIDYFTGDDGSTISLPIMGVIEIHGGLVTAWRDTSTSASSHPWWLTGADMKGSDLDLPGSAAVTPARGQSWA